MGALTGYKIDHLYDEKITLTEDVTEWQLVTFAGAVCGAGEVAAGPVSRDIDISEDGTLGEVHQKGIFLAKVAASTTKGNLVKPAASGQITPVASDKDEYVGRALDTQTTTGGWCRYIWQPGYYAV